MENRYVDSTIHKNIVFKRLALKQEFAQEQYLWTHINYWLTTTPFHLKNLIAVFICCDIVVPARSFTLRAFVVALRSDWTAMQLFCWTITRNTVSYIMSPVIVVVKEDPEKFT